MESMKNPHLHRAIHEPAVPVEDAQVVDGCTECRPFGKYCEEDVEKSASCASGPSAIGDMRAFDSTEVPERRPAGRRRGRDSAKPRHSRRGAHAASSVTSSLSLSGVRPTYAVSSSSVSPPMNKAPSASPVSAGASVAAVAPHHVRTRAISADGVRSAGIAVQVVKHGSRRVLG
jgi:hypothetical protein